MKTVQISEELYDKLKAFVVDPFDDTPDSTAIQTCIGKAEPGDIVTFTSGENNYGYKGYLVDKTIFLEVIDDTLQLTYLDDGVGFDKEKVMGYDTGGMGLKNMVSRLMSINGNYRIHSRPGAGFLAVAEIGVNQQSAGSDQRPQP